MDLKLTNRHVLVCGASSGIGRAIALEIATLGAEVTVLARREAELKALCLELERAGAARAGYVVSDLSQRDATVQRVELLIRERGPIHILVNNTGGAPSGPLLESSEEAFVDPFARHVMAAHRLVQTVLPGMKNAGFGRIINIVSVSVREPIAGLGVSNTIRGAMASWAKSISKELPPGITINNILPGYTATERLAALAEAMSKRQGVQPEVIYQQWVHSIPEGRLAEPKEIAAAVAFLASPASSYIRGVSLPVDGGRLNSI